MTGNVLHKNPRLLLVLIGIIGVAGFAAYSTLPRMEDPILVERFGIVRTVFPGADAVRVESQISQPLEEGISTLTGIDEIYSESMTGISTLGVELKDEIEDVDTVWSRVRDEISEVAKTLPDGAQEPDFRQPEMKAFATIIALKWGREDEVNFAILNRLAEDLEGEIRSLGGTQRVKLFGEPEERILVELRSDVLSRMDLTVGEVASQIEDSEAKEPAGIYRGSGTEMVMEVADDFDTLDRLGRTPIRYGSEGRLVNLADIAELSKGTKEPPRSRAVVDGRDAVVTAAFVRDEDRIDHWTAELNGVLDEFESSLPPGVELDVLFTQNTYVGDRLDRLAGNLLMGTVAVVVVVFFLMGWRSMLVVGAALPLSAMMVLAGLRVLGIPMHQMSVTGLIIALGLLIDNAIVMVDEVKTGMKDGKSAGEAIGGTIRHLALPLFGSTLTTTLAFAPIAMLPGASGEFVGSIAVSVILAINASFLLAMSVVPALAGLLQPAETSGRRGSGFWRYGLYNEWFARGYRWLLVRLFRVPVVGILVGVGLPLFGFYQLRNLPQEFFPPAERDQFPIQLALPASSTLELTREKALAIRETALEMDEIARVHWFLGESAPSFYYNMIPSRKNASFYAQALVELAPGADSREVVRELQRRCDAGFPSCRVLVQLLEQGPPVDAPVQARLFGPDLSVLQELGAEIRRIMSETRNVVHTSSDLAETVPKLALHIDEYEARMAGTSHHEIAQQMYSSLEGVESGTLVEATEELPIRVRLTGDTRSDAGEIATFQLRPLTPRGRAQEGTPLSAVGEIGLGSEVASIPRIDGKRVNEVKAFVTAGALPDVVLTEFRRRLEASDFQLPPGYDLEFAGEGAQRDEAVGNLVADVPLLISLMIAILVTAFRSFRVAFIVAVVGGLSIGLGFGGLWFFGFPFGFMGVVGTMGLVGLAVNDAIVVMAGVRQHPEARAGRAEAIADVVMRRTRHIVATTLTTMAGFTPLILEGGKFWPPVAVTIAGGVAGATILALFFVPSLYLVFIGHPVPDEGEGGSP